MTTDDVLRMAKGSGMYHLVNLDSDFVISELERFAAVVAAAEREAILQMSADNWYKTQKDYDSAIRARGETK